MGISLRQVSRLERGGPETINAEALFRAMDFLDASYRIVQHLWKTDTLPVEDIELLADEQLHEERAQSPMLIARNQPESEQLFLAIMPHLFQNSTADIRALGRHYFAEIRSNRYQGKRNPPASHVSCVILVNDQPLESVRDWGGALEIEWGYLGRGPSSLANAILLHEYGWQVAQDWGHDFLCDVIGHLPREQGGIEWTLTSDQINRWLTVKTLIQTARAKIANDSNA
jgi:transcriptional regulator with XRE-family HTH domain